MSPSIGSGQERDTLLWLADKVIGQQRVFCIPVPIEKSAELEMAKAGKIQ